MQQTSEKTPMNDLNNPILLFFSHLVIARKTQPAPENIGSYIDSRAFYIGICAALTVTLNRNERARSIYRLHMHGLPYRPPLRVERRERVENLLRRAFTADAFVQIIPLTAYNQHYSIFIED